MAQSIEGLLKFLGTNCQGDIGPLTTYTSRFGRLVYYPRAPPLMPPSPDQAFMRSKFKQAATAWASLTLEQKRSWRLLAQAAQTRITGYNLWTYWQTTGDFATVQTLINRTGIDPTQ